MSLISFIYAQEKLSFDIGDWEPFTSSSDPDSRVLEILVQEVFALYDIEVAYKYNPWQRSLKNVENGISDGTFPFISTPERQQKLLFSEEPVLIEDTVFFHIKSFPFQWDSFDDLKNYSIGGTIGYAYVEPLRQRDIDIEYTGEEQHNFRKLEAGRLDLYPASLSVGIYLINKIFTGPEKYKFTYNPRALNREKYYFLVSRNNPEAQNIMDKFNEGLKELKESGRYDEIMDRLPRLELP